MGGTGEQGLALCKPEANLLKPTTIQKVRTHQEGV